MRPTNSFTRSCLSITNRKKEDQNLSGRTRIFPGDDMIDAPKQICF